MPYCNTITKSAEPRDDVSATALEDMILSVYYAFTRLSKQEEEMEVMLKFNDVRINKSSREVFCNERIIPLTRREFDIYYHLARSRNKILTYQMINTIIWGDSPDTASNAVMHQHIYSIRNKFSAAGNDAYIENVIGFGYRIRTVK